MTHYTITDASLEVLSPLRVLVRGTEGGKPSSIILDAVGRLGAQAAHAAGRPGLTVAYSSRGELVGLTGL